MEGTHQVCAGAHTISFFQGPCIEENHFGSEQHEDVVAEQQMMTVFYIWEIIIRLTSLKSTVIPKKIETFINIKIETYIKK